MTITLYLYIGHETCGSDLIRQALTENRTALAAKGIGLCSVSMGLLGRKDAVTFPDAYFADQLEGLKAGRKVDLDPVFQKLSIKARDQKLKAVVLAANSLNAAEMAGLMDAARAHFDCKILYYFARQDDWLLETWRQGLFKTGVGLHAFVDQFLRAPTKGIYRDTLSAYAEVFGAENMRVRLAWPKVLEGGHIVADFWHAIGVGPEFQPVLPEESAALTDEMRNALKESPYLFKNVEDPDLTDFISSLHVTGGDMQGHPLDDEKRRAIMEHFKPENHWIKHTFLKDFAMPGWNSVPKRQGPEPISNDPVTVAGVTEAMNLNFALLKELREDIAKIKKNMGLK